MPPKTSKSTRGSTAGASDAGETLDLTLDKLSCIIHSVVESLLDNKMGEQRKSITDNFFNRFNQIESRVQELEVNRDETTNITADLKK